MEVSLERRIGYDDEPNKEAINANLYLMEEKRKDSQLKLFIYQKKMEKYFNPKVHRKSFGVGELVLKKLFFADKEMSSSSLSPKLEGLYTRIEVIGLWTYKLVGENDKPFEHPWNNMYLRKYYQ